MRTPLVAVAIAAAVLAFAAPAAASPCDAGFGMADIEYALDIAGAPPPAKSACPDEDEDGICDDFCPDFDGDGWCDGDKPDAGDPPDASDPAPYEPDCDIMESECHDGCFPQPTFGEFADCMNSCIARAGC